VEVLAATGVLALAAGLIGGALFQSLPLHRLWREEAVATKELRHAASWFSSDAARAQSTDLTDGAPPATSVTLSWIALDGQPRSVTYSLSGDALVRTQDSSQLEVARRVTSAGFSLSGKVLTLQLQVQAAGGQTEGIQLRSYLRRLQP
jgi:hypothetical protein